MLQNLPVFMVHHTSQPGLLRVVKEVKDQVEDLLKEVKDQPLGVKDQPLEQITNVVMAEQPVVATTMIPNKGLQDFE